MKVKFYINLLDWMYISLFSDELTDISQTYYIIPHGWFNQPDYWSAEILIKTAFDC